MLSKIRKDKERMAMISFKLALIALALTFIYFTLGGFIDKFIHNIFCEPMVSVYTKDGLPLSIGFSVCLPSILFSSFFFIILSLLSFASTVLGLLSFKSKKRKFAIVGFLLGILLFLFFLPGAILSLESSLRYFV